MYKSGFSEGSLGQQKMGTMGKERQNQSESGGGRVKERAQICLISWI